MKSPSSGHTYVVPGISCDHCKNALETKVSPVKGVESVVVDIDTNTVVVAGGDDAAIVEAIRSAGYEVA